MKSGSVSAEQTGDQAGRALEKKSGPSSSGLSPTVVQRVVVDMRSSVNSSPFCPQNIHLKTPKGIFLCKLEFLMWKEVFPYIYICFRKKLQVLTSHKGKENT